ncbi:MAG: acyl-CoA/acyl-ACP dehydrogenase, partial [Actinobacteria bacterium]|nr:acyl-CoA/acyl-ACP dehydrogenase [Actinomycetota bacterium]
MKLDLSDGQKQLRASLAALLSKESSPARVRAAEPLGFDARLWARLTAVGVPGMATRASGASLVDLAVVCNEVGSHLAPAPVVDAFVATRVLDRLGGCPDDVASGDAVAGIAVSPSCDGWWRLVPAGAVAALVVGLDGDDLVATRSDAPGVPPANIGCAPIADRTTTGDRRVLARGRQARLAYEHALDEWQVLTAAALAGLAAHALELGVDYTKQRQQFGEPIGSFQAVQQRLADVATDGDGARLLAYEAAAALGADPVRFPVLAPMAFLFAARTAAAATAWSLHFHGGYGFMLEYDVQLYFRRAKGWPLLFGDPDRELAVLAERLYESSGGVAVPRLDEPVDPESFDFRLGDGAEAFRGEVRA